MTRPLLVIDGDSFAHRSYHGLPKTIRRRGNRGGGAILGFANFLLRLYETEQPRAGIRWTSPPTGTALSAKRKYAEEAAARKGCDLSEKPPAKPPDANPPQAKKPRNRPGG